MTVTFSSAADAEEHRLDGETIARLHAALISERSVQAALVDEYELTAGELMGQGDVDSILERDLANASAVRVRDVIADIDTALSRIDAGTYGTCEGCGVAIPVERLEAIPQARRCVNCPPGRGSFVS